MKRAVWEQRERKRREIEFGQIFRQIVWTRKHQAEKEESPAELNERIRRLRAEGFTVEHIDGGHLAIGAAARFAL
jgi:hypothetical protein